MSVPPVFCRWDGDGFTPMDWSRKACDRQFVVGEVYPLVVHQQRSAASHSHEFAWLAEAWKNLPENLQDLYPDPEHLRKRALIQAGYYNEELIDVGTKKGAERVAVWARKEDDFAYVAVRGTFVVIRRAKSQSHRAMDKQEFQASKTAIMEIVAGMVGVSPAELAANAGQSA